MNRRTQDHDGGGVLRNQFDDFQLRIQRVAGKNRIHKTRRSLEHAKNENVAVTAGHIARAGRGLRQYLKTMRPHIGKPQDFAVFDVIMGRAVVAAYKLKRLDQRLGMGP